MDRHARHATLEDVPSLLAVELASYPEPWDAETFRSMLGEPSTICLVPEEPDNAIPAYALGSVTMSHSHLHSIAVLPERRGERLARVLLQALIAECGQHGATSMRLEVRSTNRPARALYQSFGFATIALRPRYYGDDDALIMQLEF